LRRSWVALVAVGAISATGLSLMVVLVSTGPHLGRDERMLSSWLGKARLVSVHDYYRDGRADAWDYDTDGDGASDLWITVVEDVLPEGVGRITRWRKDRNGDGRADWEMEELVQPGIYEEPVKCVAEDTDFDGVFDYAAILKAGRRIATMRSYDTDRDGRYDKVVWYDKKGRLRCEKRCYFLEEVAMENGGIVDEGGFNYCEWDSDMDGVMDIFEVYTETGWLRVNQSRLASGRSSATR